MPLHLASVAMLLEIPAWTAALVALAPPALKWWWGRALARRPDDPLLPERLQGQQRRTGGAFAIATVVLLFLWPRWAALTIPSMLVLHIAAGYPLRRALHQETWSLPAYVWFFWRLFVASYGLWILLAVTPWIVAAAGRVDVIVAVTLAAVLLVWDQRSTMVLRRVLGAQPVTDPELNRRFDALVAASGLARPRFEYVAMRGGVLANAVALPSLRQPGVLVTDTLLSRLTLDETAAICAHELAHLEYYDRARMRRHHASTLCLIAAAVGPLSFTRAFLGETASTVLMLWPAAMVFVLATRVRHRQQNETASDLRAVALTGNAEALASALIKLHAIARVPRRWDQQREAHATHPSLARRIRDIRAQAGASNATDVPDVVIEAPITFQDVDGSTAATFEATRVRWQQGPGITQLLEYGALVELRLQVPASGAPSLVAVDRRKQRWQLTPKTDDLAALQRTLDRVDGRLTREVPAASSPPAWKNVFTSLRWVGALIAIQFVFSVVFIGGTLSSGVGGWVNLPLLTGGLCFLMACSILGVSWFRRREGSRLKWGLPAVFVALALLTVLNDLGRVSALNGDMSVVPAAVRTVLSSAPAAVFDVPFGVRVLRLSPHGRVAAVAGQTDGTFSIFSARGPLAAIEADDLTFVNDTYALTLSVRQGAVEIAEVDVASGARTWGVQVPGLRSGRLTYSAAMNIWSVSGRDDQGRLARATGIVGGNEVRSAVWPAPPGLSQVDAWAASGTSAMAIQNNAERGIDARRWWTRGTAEPMMLTMVSTTCAADPASERRLLCTSWDGTVTRIFALDVETGVFGGAAGVSSIDGQFRMDEQTAPGWVVGTLNGVPSALRPATGELVQPPRADDDEAPSKLAVSGSMLAAAAAGDPGSRIRVYRLSPQ